ncbi:MAG: hypothetical protein Fur0043_00360 [Anaerolineales bacterium]
MTTLDLTLLPLYRLNNQELPALPGLLAMTPPRKTARGRENDRLVVYLVLSGQAALSTAEYLQLTSLTASRFFETPGALTSAMRAAAEALNHALLERNLAASGSGQSVAGWLSLAVLRAQNCTMLQSGSTHTFLVGREGLRQWYDPALSGRGLGLGQTAAYHFSQVELQPGDRLVFSAKPPETWGQALSGDRHPVSLEAVRRRLFTLARGDVNAVLMQAQEGAGNLIILRPLPSEGHPPKGTPAPRPATEALPPRPVSESSPLPLPPHPLGRAVIEPVEARQDLPEQGVAHWLSPAPHQSAPPSQQADSTTPSQEVPSAYAIPPQPTEADLPAAASLVPQFPASIPRAPLSSLAGDAPSMQEMEEPIMSEPKQPRQPPEAARQTARALVGGIRLWRRMSETLSRSLQKFLPNLLPGEQNPTASPAWLMFLIAVIVPLMVVAAGSTIYLRFGRSYQFDNYFAQALAAHEQAVNASDLARQRDAWQLTLFYLDKAEAYRDPTPESKALREEAQSSLDALLGIQRLDFYPVLGSGVRAQISRMAANESDLYLLDAEQGRVLRITQMGDGFELDSAFRCEPGVYGSYQVSPLVDIVILPRLNALDAAVLGIDAGGNLLYCAPGLVPQAIPLPIPDTNWGRVTGFTLDSGNLYVLDAVSRAIWVYVGKDASFVDRPYFFFGGQIPQIEDSIDLVVNGDELFLLHADGHLSTCSYSRLEAAPTRCVDPAVLVNKFEAYQGLDVFAQANFTQMQLAALPDASLLLLDANTQGIFRIGTRSLELQSQLRPAPGRSSPIPRVPAGAMTVNPNGILFLAVEDQVYFATGDGP